MFLLIHIALLLGVNQGNSAKNDTTIIETQEEADRKASFPGGAEKMNLWIKENLRTSINNVRYGIVRLEFTVKKNGKFSNFVIKKESTRIWILQLLSVYKACPFGNLQSFQVKR